MTSPPLRLAALLLLLLTLGLASTAHAAGGTVGGTISSTSGTVAGATAVLFPATGDGAGRGSSLTGADGRWRVTDVPAGDYRVVFRHPRGDFAPRYLGGDDHMTARIVTVTEGSTQDGLDVTLDPATTISGRVTGPDGPVRDATVVAEPRRSSRPFAETARTDADGRYVIRGLAAGSYAVRFEGPADSYLVGQYFDDAAGPADAQLVATTVAAAATGVDATLAIGGRLSGRVTGSDGSGTSFSQVRITAATSRRTTFANTSVDGAWSANLPAGDYRVFFAAPRGGTDAGEWFDGAASSAEARTVSVTVGTVTPDVNARLTPGGSISGTVQDEAGAPLGGATVSVYPAGEFSPVGVTTAAPDGTFLVPGLARGSYQVAASGSPWSSAFYVSEFFDDSEFFSGATPQSVLPRQVTALGSAIRLARGGQFTGRVVDSAGDPVVRAFVSFESTSPGVANFGVATDATGSFASPVRPVGTYTVVAFASRGERFARQERANLTLGVDQTRTADFTLTFQSPPPVTPVEPAPPETPGEPAPPEGETPGGGAPGGQSPGGEGPGGQSPGGQAPGGGDTIGTAAPGDVTVAGPAGVPAAAGAPVPATPSTGAAAPTPALARNVAQVTGSSVRVPLACPTGCRVTLLAAATAGAARTARPIGTGAAAAGASGVRVRLNARGRRLARRGTVRTTLVVKPGEGPAVRFPLRVRGGRR